MHIDIVEFVAAKLNICSIFFIQFVLIKNKNLYSLCYVSPSGQTNDNTEFVYNNIYLFSRRTLV